MGFNRRTIKTEFVDLNSITEDVRKIVDALIPRMVLQSKIAQFLVIPDLTKIIDEEFLVKLEAEAAQDKSDATAQ